MLPSILHIHPLAILLDVSKHLTTLESVSQPITTKPHVHVHVSANMPFHTRASFKSVRFVNTAPAVHMIAPGMATWAQDEWSPEPSLRAQTNVRALAEQALTAANVQETATTALVPMYEQVTSVVVPTPRKTSVTVASAPSEPLKTGTGGIRRKPVPLSFASAASEPL